MNMVGALLDSKLSIAKCLIFCGRAPVHRVYTTTLL